MLCHHFKRELCQVQLIESDDIGTIAVGESTYRRSRADSAAWHPRTRVHFAPPKRHTSSASNLSAGISATRNISIIRCHRPSDRRSRFLSMLAQGASARRYLFAAGLFRHANVMAENGRFSRPPRHAIPPSAVRTMRCMSMRCWFSRYLAQLRRGARALRVLRAKVTQVKQRDRWFHQEAWRLPMAENSRGLLHRLHGFQRLLIGHAAGVGSGGLVELFALRSRHRNQDRLPKAPASLHAATAQPAG